MNKILIFLIYVIIITGCSFNNNSKILDSNSNIPEEENKNYQEIFVKEKALEKELNANVKINLGNIINNDSKIRDFLNNEKVKL